MTGLTRHNPGQVLPLKQHPETCPLGECTGIMVSPKKTGERQGHGQWKAFCPYHGYVVYDLGGPDKTVVYDVKGE